MKEGWTNKKLKEIGRTQTGTTPSKSVKTYYGGEISFIRPAELDIDGNGSIEYNSELKLTQEGALKSRMISANSILMCCIGSVGKTGYSIKDVTCNQQINTITPYEGYNSKFVYYALLTPSFQNEVIKIANSAKATLAIISKGKWEEMSIPVPSLSEQQSIVDYLDSAFAKIDAMKANAEKALGEAKALFQASLKEMLEPKEGWNETTLGDLVVSNIVGLTRGKAEQGYDKEYPYFKMNNISPDNTLCWDDLICVDANKEELEKYSLQEGDFLFNTRNSKEWVGKSTVYRNYSTPVMLYNNNIMRIRFVDAINPVFIAYSFLADYTKDQLEKIKSGTTNVWAIYYRDLSKILLTYPLLSEQQSIIETLDSLKSKVDRLQENFDKISQECDALKQGLLRQVFE